MQPAPGGRPSSARRRCGRCRAGRGGSPAGRRRRRAPARSRCTVHPLAGRRARQQSAGRPPGRASRAPPSRCRPPRSACRAGSGTSGCCPRIRRRRACRCRRRRSWRRRWPPWRQEPLAQVPAGGLGEIPGFVGEVLGAGAAARPSRRGRSRAPRRGPDGWPGTRMCDGRSSPSCTMSSARSVSTRIPSARASLRPISWVAIDLTLTTSLARGLDELLDDAVGLVGVARPVHPAAGRGDVGLEGLHQVFVKAQQGLIFDGLGGQPVTAPSCPVPLTTLKRVWSG